VTLLRSATVVEPADRANRAGAARDGTLLVALGAALWGLDGLLRMPLATSKVGGQVTAKLNAGTIVLWEHVIAFIVLAPQLPAALRAFARCGWRERAALVTIGVGASAVATALFTKSFALAGVHHDYVTPLVLQQFQPVFAVALAVILLRERPQPMLALFAIPALVGGWLVAIAHPLHPQVAELSPALLALAAAALWGGGTVLGRYVGGSVTPDDVTTLRFAFGLLGAIGVVAVTGAPIAPGWHNALGLVLLALIPGIIALGVYYRGLRGTPASRATFAELAFPATATVVGIALGTPLTASQWVGIVVVAASVLALGWREAARAQLTAAAAAS